MIINNSRLLFLCLLCFSRFLMVHVSLYFYLLVSLLMDEEISQEVCYKQCGHTYV